MLGLLALTTKAYSATIRLGAATDTDDAEGEVLTSADASQVTDAEIAAEVALTGHLIRMGRGSQCNALNHFEIMRRLVASDAPAAVVLEDDIELSPDLAAFAAGLAMGAF